MEPGSILINFIYKGQEHKKFKVSSALLKFQNDNMSNIRKIQKNLSLNKNKYFNRKFSEAYMIEMDSPLKCNKNPYES